MKQELEKNAGAVVGIGFGALGGIVAAFAAALPVDSFISSWGVGDALMFGLAAATLGYVLDVRRDMQRQSEAKDRATRLMIALEGSALDEDPLVTLCESAGKIRSMEVPPHVKKKLQKKIRRLSLQLDGFADNHILDVDGENRLMDYIVAFAKEANQLRATSAVGGVDAAFWEQGHGKDYLERQRDMIEDEGGEVRRIFFTDASEFTEDAIKWMAQQEEYGVTVGTITEAGRRPDPIEDFIVFDDSAVVLTRLAAGGRRVNGGTIKFHHRDVMEYRERHDSWWPQAREEYEEIRRNRTNPAEENRASK